MPSNKKLLQAAAGSAGGDNLFVEDVFSTYLYEGNSTARSINNGLDLSGEGGLVWIKNRTSSGSDDHVLYDTERGVNKYLSSNSTAAENSGNTQGLMTFNNNGFSLGTDNYWNVNRTGTDIASWTFRKAAGFCDIVTYTGNGTAGRTVAHSLGSVPKMILVKNITTGRSWNVYHANLDSSNPAGYALKLNSNDVRQIATQAEGGNSWNSTAPTSSVFTLGNYNETNENAQTFVAYLFGDDAIFGEDGDEQICKVGSYTGNGTVGRTVDFGFEPQWVLIKPNANDDWYLFDTMREWTTDISERLRPNTSDEAGRGFYYIPPNATGMTFNASSGGALNANGTEYIYMAIRRPMKVPEAGTEVFAVDTDSASSTIPTWDSGFPVDMAFAFDTLGGGGAQKNSARLIDIKYLVTSSTAAEASDGSLVWDSNEGWGKDYDTNRVYISWMFKRAPKFMDVVAYTGDGTGQATAITHNLTVTPEMMIVKQRNGTSEWYVYHSATGNTKGNYLNYNFAPDTGNQFWNNTSPTATQFTAGSSLVGGTMIAYLFATLEGVSKVGSYSGTGGTHTVNCGFSNGARFILIKRTDASGDWYVWDSVRGITSGNDPYLLLNTTAAEVTNTDYIYPHNSGFQMRSNAPAALNASGGTYLFLAIA